MNVAKQQVEMFTDGACRGNPGPGGWGVLLRYGGHEKELCGGETLTTNNRMELMAAIAGLESLSRSCDVKLYTDSKYVMQGITEWIDNWKAKGWKTASRQPARIIHFLPMRSLSAPNATKKGTPMSNAMDMM